MDTLKLLAISLVIGLLFSFSFDSSKCSQPKNSDTYADNGGPIGSNPIDEILEGGVKPFKGRLIIAPYGEQ
jgi:hypothetical protein